MRFIEQRIIADYCFEIFTCCSCVEGNPVVERRGAGEIDEGDDVFDCGRFEDDGVFCCWL